MNIAIFASGTGTNARKIIEYFTGHPDIHVKLVVCNRPGAGVLEVAKAYNIPTLLIQKSIFNGGNGYKEALDTAGIEFIVLAGFLWKVPESLIEAYPGRIVNIHPALLPKHGGKGMFGANVHQAVIDAGEKETGITIHYVDSHYDNGDIIMQVACPVEKGDTAGSLAGKVHELEHRYYPEVIEKVISQLH